MRWTADRAQMSQSVMTEDIDRLREQTGPSVSAES